MNNLRLNPDGTPQMDGVAPTPRAERCAAIQFPRGYCKGGGIITICAAALAFLSLAACAPDLGEMPKLADAASFETHQQGV